MTEYYGKMSRIWADADALEDDDFCDHGACCKSTFSMQLKKSRSRVMLFLMGLNDVHEQARTQIVSYKPLLSVDEAYFMVLEDETRKGIRKPVYLKCQQRMRLKDRTQMNL